MKLLLLGAIAVSLCVVGAPIGSAASPTWQGVPLPNDLRIVAPTADVPKEIAAFSGKWQGWWGDAKQLPGVMVVEEIHGAATPEAIVVYAWGISKAVAKAGWTRVRGTFSNGELHLSALSAGGPLVTYRMNPDGSLDGLYDFRGQITRGTFQRAPEAQ